MHQMFSQWSMGVTSEAKTRADLAGHEARVELAGQDEDPHSRAKDHHGRADGTKYFHGGAKDHQSRADGTGDHQGGAD